MLSDAHAVEQMSRSEGWEALREHIQSEIRVLKDGLVGDSLDPVVGAARMQGKVQAYQDVMQFVERRIKAVQQEE